MRTHKLLEFRLSTKLRIPEAIGPAGTSHRPQAERGRKAGEAEWKGGVRTPARWFVPLAIGFLVGGVGGAGAAGLVSAAALQWTYVAYLVGLDALLSRRTLADVIEGAP